MMTSPGGLGDKFVRRMSAARNGIACVVPYVLVADTWALTVFWIDVRMSPVMRVVHGYWLIRDGN